jgi:hypothetical protein
MNRVITLLLQAGLLVSTAAAIAYAVRILLGTLFDTSWYWAGALAALAGPVAFALALRLISDRIDPDGKAPNA